MIRALLTHDPFALENFYGDKAIAGLKSVAEVRFNETGTVLDLPTLIELAQGCDVVVLDRNTPAPAAFFDACPGLIAAHRVAVDIRNIDVSAASRNGVLVTNASPGCVDAVVELTLGLMVDQARAVSSYAATYHRGETPVARMGVQLSGRTAGIIGYGEIGRRLAAVLSFLGMEVLVNDPYKTVEAPGARQVDLPELLAGSDFTICLAVANAETENLLSDDAFAAMKQGAYFVNISRGNLVNEAALERALTNGTLRGAAMDVGRADDQKPSPRLAALPNVTATPHVGGQTPAAAESQALETVEQVRAVAERRMPHNAVNPGEASRFAAHLRAAG
jgi:D-3-phosphoglycerate dehydrogenase